MIQTAHTPGPWRYGLGYRVRPDRGLDECGREIGGPTIAEINADADRCCPGPEEIDANGRLVAAAPDLLAAAEEFALMLRVLLSVQEVTNAPGLAANRAALERVVGAIRKAKGQ